MSYAMTLRDYMATSNPGAVPLASQPAYTSQFIRSLDDYEKVLIIWMTIQTNPKL